VGRRSSSTSSGRTRRSSAPGDGVEKEPVPARTGVSQKAVCDTGQSSGAAGRQRPFFLSRQHTQTHHHLPTVCARASRDKWRRQLEVALLARG
jgi:hypothetical protein